MINSDEDPPSKNQPLVGIVGVCASGKSTLLSSLTERGIRTRHIAQEHSYVKDMWKRITNPDILIFLDASYEVTIKRRQLDWTRAEWEEQQRRLQHARQNADLFINTDDLGADEVVNRVIEYLTKLSQ